jgi:hypothetical protein
MIQIIRFKQKDIKNMFLHSRLSDPLSSFYEFLILETGNEINFLDGKTVDVTKVRLNREFYEKEIREKILMNYAKRKMPYANDTRLQGAIAMYDLELGPSVHDDIPADAVVLETGWLKPIDEEL